MNNWAQNFYLKIFLFLVVKLSIHLNRRVFVMTCFLLFRDVPAGGTFKETFKFIPIKSDEIQHKVFVSFESKELNDVKGFGGTVITDDIPPTEDED